MSEEGSSPIHRGDGQWTDADLLVQGLFAQHAESRSLDYKSAIVFDLGALDGAKALKHIVAMGNSRDGGYLLIGVNDQTHNPEPLDQAQLDTWDQTRVVQALARHSAPPPVIEIHRGRLESGETLVAIRVQEFGDQPTVCTRDLRVGDVVVMREGALYIRTDAAQSKQITSEPELRELLGRAYIRRADRLLYDVKALIDAHVPSEPPTDVATFRDRVIADFDEMKL
jgi:predicted HTH transcriptional regulator